MIEKIKSLVKSEAIERDWKFHIIPVVKYARKLAELLGANQEVVEIAALLHDIGRIRNGGKDHDITGVVEAKKILFDLDASKEVIEEVSHAIRSHRCKDIFPTSLVAKIIASADAMAHFDVLTIMCYRLAQKRTVDEMFMKLDKKIEHDWHKKMVLPEAKEMIKEKYYAIRLIIDASKEYF